MAQRLFYAPMTDPSSESTTTTIIYEEPAKLSNEPETGSPFEDFEKPVCRCEFVNQWLDAHTAYFPPPPPAPRLMTRVSNYTFGPSGEHYHYSAPLPALHPPRDILLPYILPAPFRISPMIPVWPSVQ